MSNLKQVTYGFVLIVAWLFLLAGTGYNLESLLVSVPFLLVFLKVASGEQAFKFYLVDLFLYPLNIYGALVTTFRGLKERN